MQRVLLLGLAMLLLSGQVGTTAEQTVEAIIPPGGRETERTGPAAAHPACPGGGGAGEQEVARQEPLSPAAKTASNVGKAATGVAAAAVSLGAMAAMLMFM